MARIVEDISDDEFPDLTQLAKKSRAAAKGSGAVTTTRGTSRDLDVKVGSQLEVGGRGKGLSKLARVQATKGEAREGGGEAERQLKDEEEEAVEKKAPGPKKKRVLNQKSDNPLLRPLSLSSSRASRASSDVDILGSGSVRASAKETSKMKISRESAELRAGSVCLDEESNQEIKGSRRKETKIHSIKIQRSNSRKLFVDDDEIVLDNQLAEAENRAPAKIKLKSSVSIQEEKYKHQTILPKSKERKSPAPKTKQKLSRKTFSDSDSDLGSEQDDDDSDNLSDFIVNDSSFLDDGESVMEIPQPKSARRLVQGRRPRRQESDDDEDLDLDLKMRRLKLTAENEDFVGSKQTSQEDDLRNFVGGLGDEEEIEEYDDVPVLRLPRKAERSQKELSRPEAWGKQTTSRPTTAGSEIDNPFTLRFSPPPQPRPTTKTARFTTPPGTPPLSPSKPRGLVSPSKPRSKIPATPHRQSMDAFWAQDVINDWNDVYSPVKPLSPTKPKPNPLLAPQSPVKAKEIKLAKKTFEAEKHDVAEKFLKELDQAITGGKVGELATSTGGVKIVWSNKLNTTAGRANWKRETIRSTMPPSSSSTTTTTTSSSSSQPVTTITYRHHASIELASKVISTRCRLLNVLAHEYCHLANFMISNIKTNPHGKEFKIWARKVTSWGQSKGLCKGSSGGYGINDDEEEEIFEVTTKHSYEIDYKYIWTCSACSVLYKRHSKSVDPTRHQCGTCKGRLVQIKPAPRGTGGTKKTTAAGKGNLLLENDNETGDGNGVGVGTADQAGTTKTHLSEYQLFVKENMKLVRADNPGSPHKEMMGLVGKKYRELKALRGAAVGDDRTSSNVLAPGKHNIGINISIDEITSLSAADDENDKGGSGRNRGGEQPPSDVDVDDELGGVVRKLDFMDLSGESP